VVPNASGIVEVADVNGDGNPDLVDGAHGGVRLGRGDGTFAPVAVSNIGLGYGAQALGDVNGDGWLDAATRGVLLDIDIHLGKGDGTFGPALTVTADTNPISQFAFADFTGDGKLDLVYTGRSQLDDTPRVNVLVGTGDGHFGTAVETTPPVEITQFVLGDLNKDGKADLVALAGKTMATYVLLSKGDGTFLAPKTNSSIITPLAVTDCDGDGVPDLLTQGSMLHGLGDGTFSTPIPLGVTASIGAVGDLNGDGLPDLVLGADVGILLLTGSKQGGFAPPIRYPYPFPTVLAIGDFNRDGKPDIAAGSIMGDLSAEVGFEILESTGCR
jgi:hypothetical protein